MDNKKELLIGPQTGASFVIRKGCTFKVVDIEGKQVADLIAFNTLNNKEKLSSAVTIDNNSSIFLRQGDSAFSNLYNKMFTVVEDTVGKHDLLYPACSPDMYRYQYGITEYHPNCLENLYNALRDYSIGIDAIPGPINLFMNTRVSMDGTIHVDEPHSKAGDYVSLKAEMDVIVAVSACPVKESKCNAFACKPLKIVFEN